MLLLFISVCLSAPVENDKLIVKGRPKRSTVSPSDCRKCMMICLEGEPSQICFDESIDDARPGPVLPDNVCTAAGCLKLAEPCPTNVTTFRCMIERRPVLEQSDVDGITTMHQRATLVLKKWNFARSVQHQAPPKVLATDKMLDS